MMSAAKMRMAASMTASMSASMSATVTSSVTSSAAVTAAPGYRAAGERHREHNERNSN
jgi:hypothetical protein